jgi:hypothetical protein
MNPSLLATASAEINTAAGKEQHPPEGTDRAGEIGKKGIQPLLTQQAHLAQAGGQGTEGRLPAKTPRAEPGRRNPPQLLV